MEQTSSTHGCDAVELAVPVQFQEVVEDGLHVLERAHDVAADLRHVRLRVLPLRDGGADRAQHPVANLLARVQHLIQLLDVLSLLAVTRLTRSHRLTVEMGVGGCAANSCIELRDLVVLLSQLLLKGSHSTLQVTHIPGRGVSVLRVAQALNLILHLILSIAVTSLSINCLFISETCTFFWSS